MLGLLFPATELTNIRLHGKSINDLLLEFYEQSHKQEGGDLVLLPPVYFLHKVEPSLISLHRLFY